MNDGDIPGNKPNWYSNIKYFHNGYICYDTTLINLKLHLIEIFLLLMIIIILVVDYGF